MSDTKELIRSIMDEDFVAAKELTKNLVFSAVADQLELARQEVGANLFGCDDCDGEDIQEKSIMPSSMKGTLGGLHVVAQHPRARGSRATGNKLLKRNLEKGLGHSPYGTPSGHDVNAGRARMRELVKEEEVSEGYMSANRYSGGTLPKKKVSKDYDKDGMVENPKDEVLGSRINAAVKSGKLTPEQAAKTKNKGMYR
jgi:hypothetical protein